MFASRRLFTRTTAATGLFSSFLALSNDNKTTFCQDKYTNDTYGFSMNLPQFTKSEGPQTIIFASFAGPLDGGSCPTISSAVQPFTGTPADYSKISLDGMYIV